MRRPRLALREHRRRSPHDGEVMIMLARARAARGDLLDCARQLHEVPYWWPTKAESLYREGQAFLQLDRAKDAEQAWLELIKEDPLHPVDASLLSDAYRGLLRIYAIEDRWEDAYPIIWIAYDRSSGSKERLYWLTMRMRAELERVSPKESIIELRRYVAAAADDYEALHALARAEIALGDRPEAERHYQACLKMRPDYVRGWRDYLTLLEEQGELEPFLAVLRVPARHRPTRSRKSGTSAASRARKPAIGGWPLHTSARRLDLNPFLAKCYYRLGMADERMGSQEQAVVHRRKSSEINAARREFPAAHAIISRVRGRTTPVPTTRPQRPGAWPQFARSWAGPEPKKHGTVWRTALSARAGRCALVDVSPQSGYRTWSPRANPDHIRGGCENSGSCS